MRSYLSLIALCCVVWGSFACSTPKECQSSDCPSGQQCLRGKCQCPEGKLACGNTCIDTDTSSAHCGKCGNVCGTDQQCDNGTCTKAQTNPACPSPLRADSCGPLCVNLQSDNQHCGKCGNTCGRDKQCIGGRCECPTYLDACPQASQTVCVDLRSDVLNCGGCGRKCAKGLFCSKGRCVTDCPKETPNDCYGGCFDTSTSRLHCGACNNRCPLEQPCISGKCGCPPAWDKCTDKCVDTKTNWEHCGGCDKRCRDGERCAGGRCVTTCPANTPTNCFGGCFDTQSNPNHCGKCGNQCAPGQRCFNGQCTCPQGQEGCGVACADLQSDVQHCGTCNAACAQGQACKAGKCTCANGQTACGPTCVDLQSDRLHCGGCGKKCAAGQSCTKGKCQGSAKCKTPEIDCDGACIDPNASQEHCGKCNNPCAPGQRCEAGKCINPGPCQREGQTEACGPNPIGECRRGTRTCIKKNGRLDWSNCEGGRSPTTERCDGKDNDCDGKVDNMPAKPCYSGTAGTDGKGACRKGKQTCNKGMWSTCVGEVKPTKEQCNNGIDEDCDGQTDEDCGKCIPKAKKPCGSNSTGDCKKGSTTCDSNGNWGPCIGEVKPRIEICDGKDNDCDGKIDDGLLRACYSGRTGTKNVGLCRGGTQACISGSWSRCNGEVKPTLESCDNKDNDCDGQTDEGLAQICYSGAPGTADKGICRSGSKLCTNGTWGTCQGSITPKTEICDNKDNDCDGQIDEGLSSRPCYTGPGDTWKNSPCRYGLESCKNGSWGTCNGQSLPKTELCDGIDNDCDGTVDENWPNLGKPCSLGMNRNGKSCVFPGTYKCLPDGSKETCSTPYTISAEVCDGVDNDCNGTVDDNPTDITGFCAVYTNTSNQCVYSGYICSNGQRKCENRSIKMRCRTPNTANAQDCVTNGCPSTHRHCNANGLCIINR